MAGIRIAQLSDLHFGMSHQAEVWASLVDYLLADLVPDAIVATGDLVDSPEPRLLAHAADEFRRFTQAGIPWAVCAGNHDRHARGNAGFLGRALSLVRPDPAPALFDQIFEGRIANLARPIDWRFGRAQPSWRVRVIGLDSSIDARYAAQGFVTLRNLTAMRAPTRSEDRESSFDLVVALIHHHLLPIAALERSSQRATGLFRPTILVNAGSVLEALAFNNVNLVLHGHEHQPNIARYGVPGAHAASDVVIVGAGSATGARHLSGCDASRASFNVIELRDDRSVVVQPMAQRAGRWSASGDAVPIVDGRGVREGRVLRRADIAARPQSRIDRHFALTEFRDIDVRESRTSWIIPDGTLTLDVHRSSGAPLLSQLRIQWQDGGEDEWLGGTGDARFEPRRDGVAGHRLTMRVADATRIAKRLELEYRWLKSAALTLTDVRQLGEAKSNWFRARGMEAVFIDAREPLDSLTLSVSLPADIAPSAERWHVDVGIPDGEGERYEANPEIHSFLHVMPGGYASVTVPFPLPKVRYCIAWSVRETFAPDASVQANRARALAQGDSIADGIARKVEAIAQRASSVALYLPELAADRGVRFRLASYASTRPGGAGPVFHRPHDVYTATSEFDGILGAWYGEASWAAIDPDDPDDRSAVLPGEDTVFVLPAWQYRWIPASEPWGILRIGLAAGDKISEELAQRSALASAIVL